MNARLYPLSMPPPGTPKTPPVVVALVVVAAVGICLVAAAVMVPVLLGPVGAWPVLAGGAVALVVSLYALWVIQKKRDRAQAP